MKKLLGLAIVFTLAAAVANAAGISGTKHDLSAKGYGSTELCIFCHTPHNGQASLPVVPLWNHATTNQAFSVYSSPTLNATGLTINNSSKACLSCHDGVTAVDSYVPIGSTTPRAGNVFITGASNTGTDLSNDHPIGFTYDAALATADGRLVTPANASFVVAGIPLFAGKMECGSCHAVHDNANAPFLRSTNAASALCLKCHNQ